MQDTHNLQDTYNLPHNMRFSHFAIECETHGQDCTIRYPGLELCQENSGDHVFYYRPRSAMRFGLLIDRFLQAFPSHDLLITPLEGRTKRKNLRFMEDRGLFQEEENNKRDRAASRSRSRSRSRSYSGERCNVLIKKRVEDNVIACKTDSKSDNEYHLEKRVKLLEELTNRLLREREIDRKNAKEKDKQVQEGLRIQKEEIELCRQEIQTHDEQIDYCLTQTTQISNDLGALRKNLESHKANTLEKQEKWEEFKRLLMDLN